MLAALGLVWGTVASGAELSPSLPGLAQVVVRCSTALDDPCWDHARPMQRFAAAPGLHVAPVSADVALGWDDQGLLVRVDDLPDGAWLEVGLGRDARISKAVPLRVDTVGIARLSPPHPVSAGEVRRLWVNVVVPDGAGRAALGWSPVGPATPDHPARVLFTDAPAPGLPVELSVEPSSWQLDAVGGDEAVITHLRPAIPSSSRGVPGPWSVTGKGRVVADGGSPEWGWHELVAVWRNPDERPVDLVARRVWSEPSGPDGVSGEALFFPPPKELDVGKGVFAVSGTVGVCAPEALAGVARLLRRELTRMTGVSTTEGSDCTITLVDDPTLRAEGFRLVADRSGATVSAADRSGATAGAMALVDALGPDAQMPRLTATDWPTMHTRPLYHALNMTHRPDLTVDDYVRFIERVVTRGRYNQLHLYLADGLEGPSLPELALPRAWSVDDIARIKQVCDNLGIALVPGVNAPGHTLWLLRNHPELAEDVNPSLLDVRHPHTRALLSQHYHDVWAAFGKPAQLHIGHDEAIWLTRRWFSDERNPRTSMSPRGLLFAEDLQFHLDWCAERGITPYLWTDMLLEGWNGGRDGVHYALEQLSDAERRSLQAMAWSPLGDPLANLAQRYGIPVLRVHTAYLDWKRAGLHDSADALAGEGLALFLPAPWAAFAPGPGSRSLHYHLGVIVLAGATAWEPRLEPAAHIAPTLAALAGHPVLRPGFEAIPHRKSRPLLGDGARPDPTLPDVAWTPTLVSDHLVFRTDPRVARVDAPVRWTPSGAVAGVSVLLAGVPDHSAKSALRAVVNKHGEPEHQAVGWLIFEHADGSTTRRPLEHGEDLYTLDADPRANAQWRTADVVPLASPAVAHVDPTGRDLRLYRVDLAAPEGAAPVVGVRLEATRDGFPLMVGGATLLLR